MSEALWRLLVAGSAVAVALGAALPAAAQVNPLSPDQAFRFSARAIDAQTVEARFTIAEGYYLYRDKIHFAIEPAAAGLAVPRLPDGNVKDDPFFGRVETYRGDVVVNLRVKDAKPGQPIVLAAESQGCADIGICYPPTVQRATLGLPERQDGPERTQPRSRKGWAQPSAYSSEVNASFRD
jgi:thiol:disulfide interchange protein DsbD